MILTILLVISCSIFTYVRAYNRGFSEGKNQLLDTLLKNGYIELITTGVNNESK